jgi:hypothetical protein
VAAAKATDSVRRTGLQQLATLVGVTQFPIDSSDSLEITLLQFSSPSAASAFDQIVLTGFTTSGLTASRVKGIPSAIAVDGTKAGATGDYEHAIIVTKGARTMAIDYTTTTAGPTALVAALAQQQYAGL